MRAFLWLVPVASAIWVGVDASKTGVRRGRLGGGPLDLSVTSWVLATLVIWVIGFPCYLVARGKYHVLQATSGATGFPAATSVLPVGGGAWAAGGSSTTVPAQAAYRQPAPVSPDGRWFWDGQRWVPVTGGVAPPTR